MYGIAERCTEEIEVDKDSWRNKLWSGRGTAYGDLDNAGNRLGWRYHMTHAPGSSGKYIAWKGRLRITYDKFIVGYKKMEPRVAFHENQ